MLIRNDQIGSIAYDKLASIMQIRAKNPFWTTDDEATRKKVIEGFKQLYQDDHIINADNTI